jgi:peptidoglycan/LPS O-acetylase OafA/YrhL
VPNGSIEPYLSSSVRWDIWYGLCCLLGWCFVLTLLGYGQVYLNKPNLLLKRMNEAIYPFYILHQTVIVIFGYYIIQLNVNIPLKMILLFISSFLVIVLLYRLFIYPFKVTRVLFGMKKKNEKRKNITAIETEKLV